MASSRTVLQVFEQYQKHRVAFVQTVAELATRPQNVDALQQAGVMALLRPLLLDNVPSIQQSAALALGRLANFSDDLAEAVVQNEILPQLVYSLSEQNRFYKKAAAFELCASEEIRGWYTTLSCCVQRANARVLRGDAVPGRSSRVPDRLLSGRHPQW